LQTHVVTAEERGNFRAALTYLRNQLIGCGSREAIQRISSALVERNKSLEHEAADTTATNYVLMTEAHLMKPALRHFGVELPPGALPFFGDTEPTKQSGTEEISRPQPSKK
jgi:hypothetical protein